MSTSCLHSNPDREIVIASDMKQSRFFDEIATHLPGARNDKQGKRFLFFKSGVALSPRQSKEIV